MMLQKIQKCQGPPDKMFWLILSRHRRARVNAVARELGIEYEYDSWKLKMYFE